MSNVGIYVVRNTVTKQFYIGSSIDLKRRKRKHFSHLRQGKHHCSHLQRSFRKYGEENFVFEVKILCEIGQELILEQNFLDLFFGKEYCFNSNGKADRPPSTLGRKVSQNTKDKLRKLNSGPNSVMYGKKGQEHPMWGKQGYLKDKFGKQHPRSKQVQQIDPSTNQVISVFGSILEAQRETGILGQNISSTCKGKQKTAGGFGWKYNLP